MVLGASAAVVIVRVYAPTGGLVITGGASKDKVHVTILTSGGLLLALPSDRSLLFRLSRWCVLDGQANVLDVPVERRVHWWKCRCRLREGCCWEADRILSVDRRELSEGPSERSGFGSIVVMRVSPDRVVRVVLAASGRVCRVWRLRCLVVRLSL